ncbi:ATP-binding protein [Streptosporangium sp. NBC_01755]|uniref:ATP-binding protein n=1 Tax=unclassified Streptosporangium TaxID=2632669 RepID=UPI002DDC4D50|nr:MULTISPECIES: ATP-binding protein [unclassified Streptosporangium]WSA28052.1 ATP-binding protein [Streptosporangium sp. NBC_01810]WSD00475.1 ATP-binding protein [Streptosporangium sp. NBC_01755]
MSREDVYGAVETMFRRWDGLCIVGMRNFGGEVRSAGQARGWVVELLSAQCFSGEVLETARLLVSEVVTNSILHSDSGIDPEGLVTVAVGLGRDVIHIEVIDQGSSVNVPAMRSAGEDSLGGRGLDWVHRLSSGWGSDHDPEIGRAVWFRLAC